MHWFPDSDEFLRVVHGIVSIKIIVLFLFKVRSRDTENRHIEYCYQSAQWKFYHDKICVFWGQPYDQHKKTCWDTEVVAVNQIIVFRPILQWGWDMHKYLGNRGQ